MSDDKEQVRFDGIDGNVLITRKLRVALSQQILNQALRQSESLDENGRTGRWEVPNEREARRARTVMDLLGITNIDVRVAEHPNERFNKPLVKAIAAALVYIHSMDEERLHPEAAGKVLDSVAFEIRLMSEDDQLALGRQFKSIARDYYDLPEAFELLNNLPEALD